MALGNARTRAIGTRMDGSGLDGTKTRASTAAAATITNQNHERSAMVSAAGIQTSDASRLVIARDC